MTNEAPGVFDEPLALAINRGRLDHLASLGLNIDGRRVLDVGGGPGHLAQFFVKRGCDVLSVDGRPENIEMLRATYQGLRSEVLDVENERLSRFGTFDFVFCYGLLYHVERPAWVLENIGEVVGDLLVMESCIMDDNVWGAEVVPDYPTINQGLQYIGCRPTPRLVVETLVKGGLNVYLPKTRPDHPNFVHQYLSDHTHFRDGQLMRQIFVASRTLLDNPILVPTTDASELYDGLYA